MDDQTAPRQTTALASRDSGGQVAFSGTTTWPAGRGVTGNGGSFGACRFRASRSLCSGDPSGVARARALGAGCSPRQSHSPAQMGGRR